MTTTDDGESSLGGAERGKGVTGWGATSPRWGPSAGEHPAWKPNAGADGRGRGGNSGRTCHTHDSRRRGDQAPSSGSSEGRRNDGGRREGLKTVWAAGRRGGGRADGLGERVGHPRRRAALSRRIAGVSWRWRHSERGTGGSSSDGLANRRGRARGSRQVGRDRRRGRRG